MKYVSLYALVIPIEHISIILCAPIALDRCDQKGGGGFQSLTT